MRRIILFKGLLILAIFFIALSIGPLAFANSNSQSTACDSLNSIGGSQNCGGSGDSSVNHLINSAVKLISIVGGVIVVLMIIYAGYQYIISNGDSNNIGRAKTSLTYAVIGLAVIALAQFLTNFILGSA